LTEQASALPKRPDCVRLVRLSHAGIGLVWCLTLLLNAGAVLGQTRSDDPEEKPWVEQDWRLPAFPKAENLVRVPLESMKSFEVAIDATSIDIGQDGVIRYVMVARSRSGGENISFEGIRCETRERKSYAIGKADKTWGTVRTPVWTGYAANLRSHHNELAREYFCPRLARVSSVKEALNNIRRGGFER
jgi:hypothetical protein